MNPPAAAGELKRFSCSLSAVLLARVYEHGDVAAFDEVLRRAGSHAHRRRLHVVRRSGRAGGDPFVHSHPSPI